MAILPLPERKSLKFEALVKKILMEAKKFLEEIRLVNPETPNLWGGGIIKGSLYPCEGRQTGDRPPICSPG
jgi:hypothetical protein